MYTCSVAHDLQDGIEFRHCFGESLFLYIVSREEISFTLTAMSIVSTLKRMQAMLNSVSGSSDGHCSTRVYFRYVTTKLAIHLIPIVYVQ